MRVDLLPLVGLLCWTDMVWVSLPAGEDMVGIRAAVQRHVQAVFVAAVDEGLSPALSEQFGGTYAFLESLERPRLGRVDMICLK